MKRSLQALGAAALLAALAVVAFVLLDDGGRDAGDAAVVAPPPTAADDREAATLAPPTPSRAPVAVERAAPAEEPAPPPADEPAGAGLALAGRVVMVDGRGLATVGVELPALGLAVTTGAGGEFAFEGLPAGDQRLALAPRGGREAFAIVGKDTFVAGATDAELVVTASLLRVRAQTADGRPATFGSVALTGIDDDGRTYPLGGRSARPALTSADLVVPAGANLRALALGDDGAFAGLVQTPRVGGAVETVLTPDPPGLGTLELRLVGYGAALERGRIDVALHNGPRDDVLADRYPLAPVVTIPGLLSGPHTADLAIVQPEGTAAEETLAVVERRREFEFVGAGRTALTVELLRGGRLALDLSGDLAGIPPQAQPVDVTVDVRPVGGGEPLDLRWRGDPGAAPTQRPTVGRSWSAEQSLPPGDYDVAIESPLFEPATVRASIVGGLATELRVDLVRR